MRSEIGREYVDKITGFRGTCTAVAEYISGCSQLLLAKKVKAGESMQSEWIDAQRLERVGDKTVRLDNGKTPGFDRQAPIR